MMRAAWVAGWTCTGLLWVSVPALALGAIWTSSDRLGGTAGVAFLCALFLTLVMPAWEEPEVPPKPLPRKARRELREAETRLALGKAIREAEKAAGLREDGTWT